MAKKAEIQITEAVARKVLETVDAGLVNGKGDPKPGHMCVEAAICYALGLPHGDDPACVSRALRELKIRLNDSNWSSKEARAKGLRRLALAQLGSAGALDNKEFARRVAELAIRKSVPMALRAAALGHRHGAHHAGALRDAADICEKEGTEEAARKAKTAAAYAANAAANAANAANAADAAAYAAANAANAAANAAAIAAAIAAKSAAKSIAIAAANAAAYAAKSAADAAAYAAANAAARDKSLADFCEAVVQILIEMDMPGVQWLHLTETIAA